MIKRIKNNLEEAAFVLQAAGYREDLVMSLRETSLALNTLIAAQSRQDGAIRLITCEEAATKLHTFYDGVETIAAFRKRLEAGECIQTNFFHYEKVRS